jgi:alpha-beta hydrolase superfamily lysophospholipase
VISVIMTLAAFLVLAALAMYVVAVIAARRLVLPHHRPTLKVLACDAESITVPATPQTLHPGIFGVWADSDQHHTLVGEIMSHDERSRTVRRRTIRSSGRELMPGETITWTSHVFPGPAALSPAFENIDLQVDGGIAPAWLIPGARDTTRWAIHIHGIRTTRITALRSVPAANKAGVTSLVVSFRGDGEAPTSPNGASMLGSTEWHDLEPAIRYATSRGATRITIVAWSMGAEVALNYLQKSDRSRFVSDLVLIAPITDWNEAVVHALRRSHLPSFLGRIVAYILRTRRLHRIAGTNAPIDLAELDATHSKLSIPVLIVHSRHDNEAPIEASRALANANLDTVTLVERLDSGHALEYNLDPAWFTETLAGWLSTHRASCSSA